MTSSTTNHGKVDEHHCPICGKKLPLQPQYPNWICSFCEDRATDAAGRRLEFYNVDLSGGFKAVYADTKEEYPSHVCFIDGIKCIADEHRMGGVVVQKM